MKIFIPNSNLLEFEFLVSESTEARNLRTDYSIENVELDRNFFFFQKNKNLYTKWNLNWQSEYSKIERNFNV